MKYFLSLFITLLVWGSVMAQGYKLDGTVTDADDHTPLAGALVKITALSDSTRWKGVQADSNGKFLFTHLPTGGYIFEIRYLGYKIAQPKIKINGADKHMTPILLVKNPTTFKDVPIVAKEQRVKQKEDTTEYNANAYKVHPDATAEDLVTKMPGITSNNGTVTAHGETVQQVYVDGKEFFGQDATLALKNLPAEVIDRVQVFDKTTDQAQFTGFDDGNSQKAINIVTKKNKRNGVFGKIYAGYGYLTDNTYSVGASLNYFNGDQRISLIGMSNNVNQQNFATQDLLGVIGTSTQRIGSGMNGGGRGGGGGSASTNNFLIGQQPGISTTHSAGTNYSDVWGKKKKVKITASYFFNMADNANNTDLTRQYFGTGDSTTHYRENDQIKSRNINHRVNIRLEYAIDSMNKLIFTPKLNLQQNTQTMLESGLSTLDASGPISQTQSTYTSKNFGYNLGGDILYQHKFKKPRRTFALDIGSTLNNKTGQTTLNSKNIYSENDSVILDQQTPTYTNTYSVTGNATYTEPAGESGMVQLNYSPSNSWNTSNKNTSNFDSATNTYAMLDTALSSKYSNIYMIQKGGVSYRWYDRHINITLGVNTQYALLNGEEVFPFNYSISRPFVDILPSMMFSFRSDSGNSLRLFYRTSTSPPSITQLQSVIDNSNPLLLSTGNPNLKQSYTHSLLLRYGATKKKTATGFFAFVNASYTLNYVASSTFIANRDTNLLVNNVKVQLKNGSQITLPVNINGNASANALLTYGVPIEKIMCNLNLTAGGSYNRSPGLINFQPNWSNTYNVNAGFVLGSNISDKIDFTISYNGNYNIVTNTLQKASNNNYFNHTGNVKFNWLFWKGFVFNTTLQNTLYAGVAQGFNQDIFIWNAALGYKFFKDKSLEIRAGVNDILNQNSGIARTITGTYIEDSKTQVLKRYLLLTATYTLRYFKKVE